MTCLERHAAVPLAKDGGRCLDSVRNVLATEQVGLQSNIHIFYFWSLHIYSFIETLFSNLDIRDSMLFYLVIL